MNIQKIQVIVSIFTAIVTVGLSFLGFLLNKWNKKKVQMDVIKEYYKEGDSNELIQARKNILNRKHIANEIFEYENSAYPSIVCNFFNKWGLMVKYRNLPFYIFKGSSGHGVTKCYEALKSYIDKRRVDNVLYAFHFEYLYKKIKKHNNHQRKKKWYFMWLKK
ncbi:hypothetical protein [Paenibacillus sp. JJ1722]|uniref:DUF4760 domain-containing protein n=1 Tax=Paenibacillus sp. JJ1722 TaxID=3398770 RepID=UPI003AAE4748